MAGFEDGAVRSFLPPWIPCRVCGGSFRPSMSVSLCEEVKRREFAFSFWLIFSNGRFYTWEG